MKDFIGTAVRTGKDAKAEPRFFSVEDVSRYFDKNPNRLIDYIEIGRSRKTSVVGVHLAQLATKAKRPLEFFGEKYVTLPPTSFVRPDYFDNVDQILRAAREKFPASAFN